MPLQVTNVQVQEKRKAGALETVFLAALPGLEPAVLAEAQAVEMRAEALTPESRICCFRVVTSESSMVVPFESGRGSCQMSFSVATSGPR